MKMTDLFKKALDEYQKKNFVAAIKLFEETPTEEFLEANYYLALCYVRTNQLEKALECIELVIVAEGDLVRLVQVKILKGWILEQLNRIDESLSWFESLINEGLESAQIYGAYGNLLGKKGLKKEALSFLNMALQKDPNNPNLQNSLAHNLAELDIYLDKALKLVRNALSRDPENFMYLDTLGWVYYKMGNLKLAHLFLKKAYQINSHHEIKSHLKLVEEELAKKGV